MSEEIQQVDISTATPAELRRIIWQQRNRAELAEAEVARLQGIISASEERSKDWAAVEYAAHMPDDYKFGLPSWINQHLYIAYIEKDQDRAAAARWEETALKQSEALEEAIELIEASYGEGHEDKWHRREQRGDFAVKWLAKYKPEEKANGATT